MRIKDHKYKFYLFGVLAFSVVLSLLFNLIESPVRNEPLFLYALALISIFTFFLFLTICFIKHMISFLPNLLVAIGICGHLICASIYSLGFLEQSVMYSLEGCLIGIGVIGATLSINFKIKGFSISIPLTVFAVICTVLDLIRTFMLVPPILFVQIINVLCVVSLVLIIAAIFLSVQNASKTEMITPSLLCCLMAFFTVVSPYEHVYVFSFEYTLAVLTIAAITVYGFKEVIILEKKSIHFTEMMQAEIDRQTKELQEILKERETVMRFVSHDMKKPVITMRKFINVARERESDIEQIKTIDIIDQKAALIEKDLNDIAQYSRRIYVAEQSDVYSIRKIIEDLYKDLKPDCDANGISFEAEYIDEDVYVKPKLLNSVLTNVVINAIEHASCLHIKISAKSVDDSVAILIKDDGIGIDEETAKLLFKPYEADTESRTNGLGLYICKTHMTSMNGNIEYESDDSGLTFIVTVPRA